MINFKYWVGIMFILASCRYSQTTLSGRLIGLSVTDLDSASVLIKDGTGGTTYARASASKDGSFYLKTNHIGTLMAEFICPHFKALQVALLCDKPTKVNVDVTMSSTSDAHGRSSLTFHDSLTLLAKYALLHLKTNRRLARNAEEYIKRRSEGKQGEKLTIDWTDDTHAIEEALANEKEPVIRQELIIQFNELIVLGASSASEDSLKKWILEIPPTSPAWVYHGNLALSSSKVYRPDALQYVNDIIAQHPNELFAKYLYDCVLFGCHEIGDKKYSSTNWSSQARPQCTLEKFIGK